MAELAVKPQYAAYQTAADIARYPVLGIMSLAAVYLTWEAWDVVAALGTDVSGFCAFAIHWIVFGLFFINLAFAVFLATQDVQPGYICGAILGFTALIWALVGFDIHLAPARIVVPAHTAMLMADGSYRYSGQSYVPGFWEPVTAGTSYDMIGTTTVVAESKEKTDRTHSDVIRQTGLKLTVTYKPGRDYVKHLKAAIAAKAAARHEYGPSSDQLLADEAGAEVKPWFEAALNANPTRFHERTLLRTKLPWVSQVVIEQVTIGYAIPDPPKEDK